jgi:hypothetical protein
VRRSVSSTVLLCASVTFTVGSLAGCGFVSAADRTHKPDGFPLHGYVSVAGLSAGSTGAPCASPAGDIFPGADVKVADANGKAVASGALGNGVLAAADGGYRCNFPFEIANVSGSPPTLVVLVGAQPAASFTTSELREGKPAVVAVASVTASRSPS